MNKAIFFDRDGVLNKDPGYVHTLQDFCLFPGAVDALKRVKGFLFFIVSNQSGIGRGLYTDEDFHRFNNHLLFELKKHVLHFSKVYYCPHSPEDKCDCRKPKTKFIMDAKAKNNLNLKHSWVIGDHASDIKLGKNASCKTIHLLTGHGTKELAEVRKYKPDYVAAGLGQATDFIMFNRRRKIVSRGEITRIADEQRKEGKTIVTINGTFDILHKGHEFILKSAKKQGDMLIVGLNTDSSVKQNKGPGRPINGEKARAMMLANFPFVDYVVLFDEKTPIELLEEIRPDVHVNGSEYGKECIEAPTVKKHGGKIYI